MGVKRAAKKTKSEKINLRQFALDMRSSQIFTSAQVPPDLWASVFMPILFIQDKAIVKQVKEAAVIWGHMKDSMPRGVNGWPIFHTFGVLSKEEWEQVKTYLKELDEWEKKPTR